MIYEYSLSTKREEFYDITERIRDAIRASGAANGICMIYCPHTTAAITINEGYDRDVADDLLYSLEKAFPDRSEFHHSEGNSAAHLKASVVGSSATVIIEKGRPVLGTWQAVFFCEFDGPRDRKFYVKVLS